MCKVIHGKCCVMFNTFIVNNKLNCLLTMNYAESTIMKMYHILCALYK